MSCGYEINRNVCDNTSEDLLKVTGDAVSGTDVHHVTPPRSGAGGDLPPRMGGQDVAAATTTNPPLPQSPSPDTRRQDGHKTKRLLVR